MHPARAVLCAAALLSLGLLGCRTSGTSVSTEEPPRPLAVVSDGWLAMGTFFDVDLRVRSGDVRAAKEWTEWARDEIARLEAIYSRYDPKSELSGLNQALASGRLDGKPHEVSPEMAFLIGRSAEVWSATGGAFDITVGPLIEVWNAAALRDEWPAPPVLRAAKASIGVDRLTLNENILSAESAGMRIDLDGISKGAALDVLGESFRREFPGAAALLSFGESSILAIGDPDGGGWRLGVASRDPSVGELARLSLRDRALSASSSVGSVRVIQDERVSHIVDARTGSAIRGVAEAVVIAESAAEADAWSTALLVLGARKESIRLVERAGLEAYVFEQTGGRTASSEHWGDFIAR